jgi:WD40-like Beta Propeller Repeat
MNTKLMARRYFCIIMVIILIGCTPLSLQPTATSAPEFTSSIEPTEIQILLTNTPLPSSSLIAPLPTITSPYTYTSSGPTPLPMPVSTAAETFPLDNLRMAYIVDGNLYVQDGNHSPKQLSNSGEDHSPIFSSDGEKIVFHRGRMDDNESIVSINADGSDEQEVITKDWLTSLGKGTKTGQLVFVPHTHQMLFNTYVCYSDGLYSIFACTVGLFLANTDTGKIKEIMPPAGGGDFLGFGNFSVSPDGKLMSIAHDGQIDILGIDGKVIHPGIIKYTRSKPLELYPRVFWLSDSSGLILALPAETDYRGAAAESPDFTVWHYTFGEKVATQILLDLLPTWVHMDCGDDVMSVSPNGKWAVFFTNDLQIFSVNLADGTTHFYPQSEPPYIYCLPALWSSDNIHFAGGDPEQSVLGSSDTSLAFIPSYFVGWIDARRYIYFLNIVPTTENIQLLVGEIGGETLLTYKSNISILATSPYSDSFAFVMLNGK